MIRATVLSFATALLTGSLSIAQQCPGTDTFWKRDTLPATPTGLTGVSVIAGLCEGESGGVVFEMPASMGIQKITQVVAPWGATGGINGFNALLDVEVYDGVSFSGAVANMGTRVFSLSLAGGNMQVASHGLNVLDVSAFDIRVGMAPPNGSPFLRRFAVCFRVDINFHPTGSCANGWPADLFTDNTQGGSIFSPCNFAVTPQRTSLIEIQGQGWRDAALATVSGFSLCPAFYSGIWCIRACSHDAFPASYTTFGAGCAGSLGVTHLTPASLPRIGTTLNVILDNLPVSSAFMLTGFSNTVSALGPLPVDLTPLGAPGCSGRVSLDANLLLFGSNHSALWSFSLPNASNLIGMHLYQQALALDPGFNLLGAVTSDAATIQIGN